MKFIFILYLFVIFLFAGCASNDTAGTDHSAHAAHGEPKTHEDSLMKEVMDGHDFTMAKMNKVSAFQKMVQQASDSINALPEKSRKASAVYKTQLDSLSERLKYADYSMNKWMEEFNYDTATNGANRNAYLQSENEKINAVKVAMVSVLQQADSLFRKN